MRRRLSLLALCSALLAAPLVQAEPLPQRWVSAGGALSEWLVLLGGEAKLVGVDSTSQHPPSLRSLPGIGYQRQLAAEGILSLRPDVLLGSEEMGPPPVLAQLKAAGVQVEVLSARADLASLSSNLTRIGALLGAEPQAQQALAAYQQRLQQQQADWIAQAQQSQAAPKVLLLLGHAGGNPLVAGGDTAGGWLIERAGAQNLATHSGYKALSTEALAALDADLLIVADRSLSGDAAAAALLKNMPVLAAGRAAQQGRIVLLDPTLLVGGLGPRVPDQLAALAAGFYPAAHALTANAKSQP
ncbi:hemin ABC transporter substrate-binding protein [Pseudomonas sp.]|uniref:heme/hemin ABC transporter substrate-binding protein n=1 Tax=Pseudomonas sp. TaxID=306 RepID=UPI003524B695